MEATLSERYTSVLGSVVEALALLDENDEITSLRGFGNDEDGDAHPGFPEDEYVEATRALRALRDVIESHTDGEV